MTGPACRPTCLKRPSHCGDRLSACGRSLSSPPTALSKCMHFYQMSTVTSDLQRTNTFAVGIGEARCFLSAAGGEPIIMTLLEWNVTVASFRCKASTVAIPLLLLRHPRPSGVTIPVAHPRGDGVCSSSCAAQLARRHEQHSAGPGVAALALVISSFILASPVSAGVLPASYTSCTRTKPYLSLMDNTHVELQSINPWSPT